MIHTVLKHFTDITLHSFNLPDALMRSLEPNCLNSKPYSTIYYVRK